MSPNEPRIYVSRWWKREDGLILPSTITDRVQSDLPAELPPELHPEPLPVVVHKPVEAGDQMHAFLDEDLIGEPVSSLGQVRAMVQRLGLEPALEALSILAARLRGPMRSVEAQLALAEMVYHRDPELLEKIRFHARTHRDLRVVAEQHVFALMQLLLKEAPFKAVGMPPSEQEAMLLPRALLGMTSVTGAVTEHLTDEFTEEEQWLPYLLQLAFFYADPQPMVELARAQIVMDIAAEAESWELHNFCPIEEWYRDEVGLSSPEQNRLMMTLAATANAFDPFETKTRAPAEAVENLLFTAGLVDKRDRAIDLISASREDYLELFEHFGEGPGSLIWELRPFKQKPFFRCEDGSLILLSPRFVQNWLTDGFHYRALDAGRKHGKSRRYMAFAGKLYEEACLRLMRDAHRNLPGVEVRGEQPYQRGPAGKTSDVAVDYVTDLVLIEATNSRPRAETLVSGDRDMALEDLDRVLIHKCRQLDGCITRLLAGDASIPADSAKLQRIWPIVVSAGVPMQSPHLWSYLYAELAGRLQQAQVQPLVLLDPEEYELLCGMIEDGHLLPQLLTRKTDPAYRHLDLKAWFNDDPGAPRTERRPRLIERAYKASTKRMVDGMNFSQPERGAA